MLERNYRVLTRLIGNRALAWAGKEVLAHELAKDCPMLYAETVVKIDDGKENIYHIEFGYRMIRFPGREENLGFMVVRGFGQ